MKGNRLSFHEFFAHVWGEKSLNTDLVGRIGSVIVRLPITCFGDMTSRTEFLVLWLPVWEGIEDGDSTSGAGLAGGRRGARSSTEDKGRRAEWDLVGPIGPSMALTGTSTPTLSQLRSPCPAVHLLPCLQLHTTVFPVSPPRLLFTVFVKDREVYIF